MNDVALPEIFAIRKRFLRSTNIERDWADPRALEDYVITQHALENLARLVEGLSHSSSLRAWRITGDYGSGKSSFALLLAHLFSKRLRNLPIAITTPIRNSIPELFKRSKPTLLPVLITGSREAIGAAILRNLAISLQADNLNNDLVQGLQEQLETTFAIDDNVVLRWVQKAQKHVVKNKIAGGIVLILDEAGKFLEYAAMQREQQDVFLLQSLAELASRSRENPLFIITLFHQGINAYTNNLPKSQRREWEKVAGRFEEIIWHQPVEQVAQLAASALNSQLQNISEQSLVRVQIDMRETLQLGWYGREIDKQSLQDLAQLLYPLHPTVLPVLVRLFSSIGQNERSLFSFLLGEEPDGLQSFVSRTGGEKLFRLHNLYDYARSAFGTRLGSYSYYWKTINATVASYIADDNSDLEAIKTIGLLNVLNYADLSATKDLLVLALGNSKKAKEAIARLQSTHRIYFRGKAGGYCIWSNTSVNLEDSYLDAKKALGATEHISTLIKDRIENKPLVARRHYINTGTLRYFEVRYVEISSLQHELNMPHDADGLVIVPLCETSKDVAVAIDFASNIKAVSSSAVLIALPQPLQFLTAYLDELRRWEWVERSTGDLRHDRYAREEVSRQLALAKQQLSEQLESAIGLLNSGDQVNLTWFYNGQAINGLNTGRNIMSQLTVICDHVYNSAPYIHNELINRRVLSGAGSAARLRICERLFEFADKPLLGMSADKHPPEMSMYLSVLRQANIHQPQQNTDSWAITLPDEEYDAIHCRVLPAMHRIHEFLLSQRDLRVPLLSVFKELHKPPYGVRDGLIPLLLAVFAVIHEQELAFYEDGSFIPRVTGTNFLRLIKAPETFDIQYYPITGIRSDLFQLLVRELALRTIGDVAPDILDVVKPLLIFTAGLPDYALKTTHLLPRTRAIRSALITTKNPVQLLFHDLPLACDLPAIPESINGHETYLPDFAKRLKESIDELRAAYPLLLNTLWQKLSLELQLVGSFEQNRPRLSQRASALINFVSEPRLKSFCFRLADTSLAEDKWMESLGNLLCSMPPAKWRDADGYKFEQEVHKLCSQFLRVEAVVYSRNGAIQDGESVRMALTHPNGEERDQVIHLSPGQLQDVQILENELAAVLRNHGQIGMAAASRVLWQMMAAQEEQTI